MKTRNNIFWLLSLMFCTTFALGFQSCGSDDSDGPETPPVVEVEPEKPEDNLPEAAKSFVGF